MNKQFEKNDFIEVDIIDSGLGGEGVAKAGDTVIFIKNAIKGERVRAKIILAKERFCVAVTDKILITSPCRAKPPCPYFGKCGGCSMQHINYETQKEYKKESLKNTLKKQGVTTAVNDIISSKDVFSYRNKLSLPVRETPPKIGFFAKNSHRIIDIDNCLLQSFDCKKLIGIFKNFMAENSLSGYDESNQSGDIRHLVARAIGEVIIIAVVTNKPLKTALGRLNNILKAEYGESYALYGNLNTKNNNIIFSDDFTFIGGNNKKVCINGLMTDVHPAAFFQVNNYIKDLIYSDIKTLINSSLANASEAVIIDAYSGAGVLGAQLCGRAKKVYSIEINKEADAAARRLKAENNLTNFECINGDCAEVLPKIIEKENSGNTVIILDPPRSGADERVLCAINNSKIKTVIYLSCNPATLARDLKILSPEYNVISITPYDMFPQTSELETLVYLERK